MNAISQTALLGFVERYESLVAEIAARKDDQKVVLAEAQQAGLSPKGIKFCAKVRAQKPHDFQEAEQLRDQYLHAIGMGEPPPLFRAIDALSRDSLARADLVERFKGLIPSRGEIVLKLEGSPPLRLWRDEKGGGTCRGSNGGARATAVIGRRRTVGAQPAGPGRPGCGRRWRRGAGRSGREGKPGHRVQSVPVRRCAPVALGCRLAARRRQ